MDVKEKKTGRPVINTPDTRRRKRRELESVRKKCSVHIGAEIERWNALRVELKLKTHQELAALLLDRYEESCVQGTIPSADNITYSTPGPSKKPRLQPPDESDILEAESTVLYEKNRAQDTVPSTDNITYLTPGPSKKSRWKLPEVLDISEAELRGVRATCIPHPVRGMEISKHRNQLGKERLPYLPQHASNHVTCIQHPEIGMATSSEKLKHRNRLAMERSPYILQHATNPVDWYPWGQEAFDRAKAENKLIFLSVGYSTCHWCHVMERESFENAEIGKILNENFVSIKVDREERPDVDRVYMTFIQATSGDSGWPMSVWLTPDLKPLYGGTYFPPNDRHFDRPGLKSVLMNIAHQWKTKQAVIEEQTVKILNTLKKGTSMSEAPGQSIPDKQCVQLLFSMLDESFDSELGGFGKAPKFPQPVNFNFLFRMYSLDQESSEGKQALFMALFTLKMMANGGIFDHVAKGFHRYSTDKHWHVPHFEKMLYDQGQLLFSFAEAHQITKDKMFETVARDIVQYVSRDLSHISGGFYSAEDADSFPTEDSTEKKEGAFCVWTHAEIKEYLSEKVNDKLSLADIFCFHFNVKQDGNVDPYQDPHEELKKQNVLIVKGSSEETAKHFNMSVDDVKSSLEKCRQILYEVRLKRPKPHLDNKMIASWNGLMISGLAKTGQVLNDPKITQRAVDGATFLQTHMYSQEKQIMYRTSYVDDDGQVLHGSPEIEGFIDDYAFVIRGLLDLYEATFEDKWLKWAEELQLKQNELFLDRENGGYYSNSGKDASIIMKLKDDQDWAEPCANSVAVNNLLRMSNFLNRPDWYNMSAQITTLFYERLTKVPIAVPEMVCGLMSIHTPLKQIVIVGEKDSKELNLFLECVNSVFFPNKIVILFDKSSNSFLSEKLEFLNSLTKIDGKTTAYVCENYACSLPVNTISDLKKLLQKARKSNM